VTSNVHIMPALLIERILAGAKDHEYYQPRQYNQRKIKFHVVANVEETFVEVDKYDCANQDRDLNRARETREQSKDDQGSAQSVGKDDVMSQRGATEVHVDPFCGRLKRLEVKHELKTFESDEHTQDDAENVEPARPMRVSPTLNIRDDTHNLWIWYLQSLLKNPRKVNHRTRMFPGIIAGNRPTYRELESPCRYSRSDNTLTLYRWSVGFNECWGTLWFKEISGAVIVVGCRLIDTLV
jgi:hypothetical protein